MSPIFEARCPKCRKTFEELRPIAMAGEPYFCPRCGRQSDKIEFSSTSPFIRGSGQWTSPASKR